MEKGEKKRVADAGDLTCHSRRSLFLVDDLVSAQVGVRLDAQIGRVHVELEGKWAVGPAIGDD